MDDETAFAFIWTYGMVYIILAVIIMIGAVMGNGVVILDFNAYGEMWFEFVFTVLLFTLYTTFGIKVLYKWLKYR